MHFAAWQTMNVDMWKYSLAHAGQAVAADLVYTLCINAAAKMQMLYQHLKNKCRGFTLLGSGTL